jgi:hypothetical protein
MTFLEDAAIKGGDPDDEIQVHTPDGHREAVHAVAAGRHNQIQPDIAPPPRWPSTCLSRSVVCLRLGVQPVAVNLMTAHASKGLEFDAVFVAGLEKGEGPMRRPHSRRVQGYFIPLCMCMGVLFGDCSQPSYVWHGAGTFPLYDKDEERRLMFVAMTRARKHLHLTWRRRVAVFQKGTLHCPVVHVFHPQARTSTSPSSPSPLCLVVWCCQAASRTTTRPRLPSCTTCRWT